MANLNELTIRAVAAGLRAGDFSSEEVAQDCFKRIRERNDDVNAFVHLTEESALERAREIDKKGFSAKDSLLKGVPVGLKDIFSTKGVRTTCCSPGLKDYVPPYDASVVERLRDAGMVMIGKTNMDEFACGASTEHSCFGVTKNPVDLDKVAGGSSGGSAAAVADDMCIYSLGTDTGGSIRQPASLCGTYGLKVTYGRVSRSGVTAMASSWDTIGPFGKSVDDLAIVLGEIAGKDRRDMTMPDEKVPDYTASLGKGVKGLKIGLPKEYFGEGIEKETKDVVMASVKRLEKEGAEIVKVSLPMTKYAIAVYYISMPAEVSANMERYDGIRFGKKASGDVKDLVDQYFVTRGEGFGDEMKRRIMIGTYVLSAGYMDAYYKKAMKVRTKIIEDFAAAFKKVDVLIGPVSPYPAFGIGEKLDDPLAMYMADALTIPASAAGLPSLACPAGSSKDGLPIGLQIIAPQFQEGLCLRVGEMV
ncbi:Asp-tRNA(Asn)/Glu-tRNA(Gln) amidotransferase subunit GatA [Candidatus Peregrinibacteria bacterium]|jgi:aspartyl-tRNA(Asn)/glutamyl-tRNA(Gln) amidotransferase subunit A|nr:Asp-tRNA(Asn)/Glu-tRNA(Gln) amidotransferase subunit GatA [Candidatus Peregrinibacteria bacterium]MBT4148498.1 Asp-tRNA(Asn)/Glu-tRNA(Gln) amidotransferase subunit GatA [Candidatus Peregrinibacteria bacterium]MBT4366721.1 Asp-tRNA(Asn)/Glu-tRNA(Gln) amidotransferase subunit GatA [Candidatus Peregrinibacteria bacterium]MBT4455708.1 Asp-tRNA(Asn)/Glu-tRNA(Gln) amidotransferase subunit GatA [Candidatus Peregrinibacteria bacterium]